MVTSASLFVAELREFVSFTPGEQRYIKRSLAVGLRKGNPLREWARDRDEESSIRAQGRAYQELDALRALATKPFSLNTLPKLMPDLMSITAFDLNQGSLVSFSAYRFLYERLLGARARPWLPAAFCGAAALPHIVPERRKTLLQSISEAAATAPGWSENETLFSPEWVDKEAVQY